MMKFLNRFTKKQMRITIMAIAVVIVATVSFFLISDLGTPVKISKIETIRALSSRVENAPAQSSFKQRDPIMLHFEYISAKVGVEIKFDVKDYEGKTVKNGATTVLRQTDNDPCDGQRFISIVNVPSTALPIGKYKVYLSSEDRLIRVVEFEITE